MPYLIAQIAVCLLFVAAIALIVGWLLRGFLAKEQVRAVEAAWTTRVGGLRRERDRLNAKSEELTARVSEAEASRAQTDLLLEEIRDHVDDDGTRSVEALSRRVAQLEEAAGNQSRAMEDNARTLAERAARIGELESELTRAREGAHAAASALAEADRRSTLLEGELRRQHEDLRVRKPAPGRAAPSPEPPPPEFAPEGLWSEPPTRIDGLQAISGIGPVLEGVLNRLGIYQFRQIARLSPDNITWLGAHLDWFPQRILNDDWVGQARRLHDETYPDEPLDGDALS